MGTGKAFLFLLGVFFTVTTYAEWGIERIHTKWAHEHGILGQKQKIAVLDTGLKNKLNQKNVKGWNFVHQNSDFNDDHGHGTHITEIIRSIAPEAEVHVLKVIDLNGSVYTEAVNKAIDYAIANSIKIINCSWYVETTEVFNAFKKAQLAGILIVAAAGNDGLNLDFDLAYPASFNLNNMLNVAASTKQDKLSVLSNWGRHTVHLAAPGEDIISNQLSMSGASQAAAHVTGALILLWQKYKDSNFNEIKNKLIQSVDRAPHLEHKTLGGGVVNIKKSLMGLQNKLKDVHTKNWEKIDFHLESSHPIKIDQSKVFKYKFAGAKFVRIHFEKISLVSEFEYLLIGHEDETYNPYYYSKLTGNLEDFVSDYIPGDSVILYLKSEPSTNYNPGWGFKIKFIEIIK